MFMNSVAFFILDECYEKQEFIPMFTPSTFKEEDPEKLLAIMQENAFATIVTTDEHGVPIAIFLPHGMKNQAC